MVRLQRDILVQRELFIFEYCDKTGLILDPDVDDKSSKINDQAKVFARDIINNTAIGSGESSSLAINGLELDDIASTHCDKWLEGTSLHLDLYSGYSRPILIQPNQNNGVIGYKFAKQKSYSGDISGLIGEAIFGVVLTKKYKVPPKDFAHFGTTSTIYPDFGIYRSTQELVNAADKALSKNVGFSKDILTTKSYVLPAEVKGMASPDVSELSGRIRKAFRQLRSFWRTRNLQIADSTHIVRGPSIVFIALRSDRRQSYDGHLIWLT